jgi:hypothetical protein
MSLFDFVVGKPLATTEERAEHIGPIAGIPVLGLDALSSAAYGPDAEPLRRFSSVSLEECELLLEHMFSAKEFAPDVGERRATSDPNPMGG